MTTVVDADRLRSLVVALETLLGDGAVSAAAVNPDGTPGHVAAGELIESAWGNAVVDTLTMLRGVGVYTGTFAVGAGQAPIITWTGEAYDTDGYHVSAANDIVIPANRAGTYVLEVRASTDVGVSAVADLIVNFAGVALTSYIPVNRRTVATGHLLRLGAGTTINVQLYNEGAARNFNASLELIRVAI